MHYSAHSDTIYRATSQSLPPLLITCVWGNAVLVLQLVEFLPSSYLSQCIVYCLLSNSMCTTMEPTVHQQCYKGWPISKWFHLSEMVIWWNYWIDWSGWASVVEHPGLHSIVRLWHWIKSCYFLCIIVEKHKFPLEVHNFFYHKMFHFVKRMKVNSVPLQLIRNLFK